MPLDNFKKDPPGLWFIIQNSLPFSWLKNSRKNIKTTKDIFSYIKLQFKLLKDQEIEAKQTDNMFTGTLADQQRKDVSIAGDPARPNIHATTESSPLLPRLLTSWVLHVILPEQTDRLSNSWWQPVFQFSFFASF